MCVVLLRVRKRRRYCGVQHTRITFIYFTYFAPRFVFFIDRRSLVFVRFYSFSTNKYFSIPSLPPLSLCPALFRTFRLLNVKLSILYSSPIRICICDWQIISIAQKSNITKYSQCEIRAHIHARRKRERERDLEISFFNRKFSFLFYFCAIFSRFPSIICPYIINRQMSTRLKIISLNLREHALLFDLQYPRDISIALRCVILRALITTPPRPSRSAIAHR